MCKRGNCIDFNPITITAKVFFGAIFDQKKMDYTTLLGYLAATCTTVCNIPQVVKIIRTRETKGISALTYSFLLAGLLIWVVYGVLRRDWPVVAANTLSALICAIVLTLKLLSKRALHKVSETIDTQQ